MSKQSSHQCVECKDVDSSTFDILSKSQRLKHYSRNSGLEKVILLAALTPANNCKKELIKL